jgi:hypothetical protein
MNVDGNVLQMLDDGAKLLEILVGRILEVHPNVDIHLATASHTRCFVRQGLFVGMERQVDDVAGLETVDTGELLFIRLTGHNYPIIEATPVVDGFRVGYSQLIDAANSVLLVGSRRPAGRPLR